jgi:hypothetical protein
VIENLTSVMLARILVRMLVLSRCVFLFALLAPDYANAGKDGKSFQAPVSKFPRR